MIVDDIGELKSSDCFIETMGCVLPFFTGRDIDFFFLSFSTIVHICF